MSRNAARPACVHCRHFFVTWEPDQPRGCRAYGFKSSGLPSDVVLASSGRPCQLYQRKTGRASQSEDPSRTGP